MLREFFAPAVRSTALIGVQQRFIQILSSAALVLVMLGLLPLLITSLRSNSLDTPAFITLIGLLVLNGLWLWLVSRGEVNYAALGLVITFTVIALGTDFAFLLFATLAIISAATLANSQIYAISTLLVLGKIGVNAVEVIQSGASVATVDRDFLLPLVALTVTSLAIRFFVNTSWRALDEASRTTSLLQASADIGQLTTRLLDLDELLNETIEAIRTRFSFYHVQVFLINDTGEQALLVASTGDVGKRLLARKHRLAVGSQSVIGQVTLRGTPIIASDTDRDAIHARNELLPDTRAELALPILDGTTIIGALDVQSIEANAFQPDDIRALQVIANLLATAIRNARFFKEQAETAAENQRLYQVAESNLREIQRLNQQLTRGGWQEYMNKPRIISGVNLENNAITPSSGWTDIALQAGKLRRPVTRMNGAQPIVAVPLVLRGEVIGTIEVEPSEDVTETDTVEVMQAVAQRLAVSLDNARLFEEAQEATAQEQRINQIVERYQGVTSVDDLLRVTLSELSASLGAQRSAIRLGAPQAQNGVHHD